MMHARWTALLLLMWMTGCSDPHETASGDAGEQLRAADAFWDELALCGDEMEAFDDIVLAMEASDGAVVGYISSVEQGNSFVASTDDFYAEVNITVRVEETLREGASSEPTFSVIHVNGRADRWAAQINALQANLPSQKVVVLLRKRGDIPDLHHILPPMSGLWTRTTRNALDNPIAHDGCEGHYGDELNAHYLKGAASVDELVDLLRE